MPIPFTMEMYKAQLQKMMTTPMAMGQPLMPQQAAGTSIVDKLRAAATSLTNTAQKTGLAEIIGLDEKVVKKRIDG